MGEECEEEEEEYSGDLETFCGVRNRDKGACLTCRLCDEGKESCHHYIEAMKREKKEKSKN